jgi:hypothetical protein
MQVNKTPDTILDTQITALRRLHQQVAEATKELPYYPVVENIRIRNLRSSKTGSHIGAQATGSVKMVFSADIVLDDDVDKFKI